jgi:aryl-alcohol dehydrogenase-like predicted oxidoreductase
MEYVALGRGGPKVSAIGLGMWQAGGKAWGSDVRDADCRKAMERAVELGINLVDTAEAYGDGHSEKVMSGAIKNVGRDNVFIATKVGGWHLRPDDVRKACAASLKRLGVREIDLYQVHWPDPWSQVPLRETMKALEALHRAGKIRHIGVSNFAVRDLREARSHLSRADLTSNQVRYNMLQREVEKEILPYCAREGIGVLAWSPIGKGLLSGKYHNGKRPKDRVRSDEDLFKPANVRASAPLVRELRRIGQTLGKTPAQVALAWLRRHPHVVPIPGGKRPAQAAENAGAAGWSLSSQELQGLDRILRRMRLDTF